VGVGSKGGGLVGVGSKVGGLVGSGSRVFVGGTDVAVGGMGVWMGGIGVPVGGATVFEGGTLVFAGRRVRDGTGVGTLFTGGAVGARGRVGWTVCVGVLEGVAVGKDMDGMYNACPIVRVSAIKQLAICSSFGLIFTRWLREDSVSPACTVYITQPWGSWQAVTVGLAGGMGVAVGGSHGRVAWGDGSGARRPGWGAAEVGTGMPVFATGATTIKGKIRYNPILVSPWARETPIIEPVRNVTQPKNKATPRTNRTSRAE
jgi:hypothetical protein